MVIKVNKYILGITIAIILGSIIGLSSYKVITDHNKKVLLVESKYIIETAKKCINEKKCSGNTITLQTLYDLGYLSYQVNEVTKEYYNSNSYVLIEGANYSFVIVN